MHKLFSKWQYLAKRCFPLPGYSSPVKVSDKGFTLIEVILAVIIMGLAYVAILQSFSLSNRNIFKVEQVRNNMLAYALKFEKQSFDRKMDSDSDIYTTESVFMEGSKYQLLLVSDETETFMTLKLEKL